MTKTPPPRRNYAQMVRVVRDESSQQFSAQVPYQLGKAYGTEVSHPSETRVRSLDEIGINSRSPNQFQQPAINTNYNRRESTTLYHQLSSDQQQYFDGTNPNPSPTRLDARPGTKTRAYLSSNAPAEQINVIASERSSSTLSGSTSGNTPPVNEDADTMNKTPTHSDGKVHHSLPVSYTHLTLPTTPYV